MPKNNNIDIYIDEKINRKLDKMLNSLKSAENEKYNYGRIIKKYFGDINKQYNGDNLCHLLVKKYILDENLEELIINIFKYLEENNRRDLIYYRNNNDQTFLELAIKYNCNYDFIYNILMCFNADFCNINFDKEYSEIKSLTDYLIKNCNNASIEDFLLFIIHYPYNINVYNMSEQDLDDMYNTMMHVQQQNIKNNVELSYTLSKLMLIIKFKNIEAFVKELEEMEDIISFVNLFHKDKQYEILYALQQYEDENVALEKIKEVIKNNELLLSTNIIKDAVGHKKSVNYISELLDFFASMGFCFSSYMIRFNIMEEFIDKRRSCHELADMYVRVYKYGFHENDLYDLVKRYNYDFENYYKMSFEEVYSLILGKSLSIILDRSLTKSNIKFKRDEIYSDNFTNAVLEIKTLCPQLIKNYNDFILCDMLVNKISGNLNSNIMYNLDEISASDILKVLKNIIMEEMENEVNKILIKSKKENVGDTNA